MRELLELLDHFVYTTDKKINLGVAGFIHPPSEVNVMVLKHFWRKEVGYEILRHQLIIFVCFRSPLSSLLFKHLYGLSDRQVTHHPKMFGSLRQCLSPDNLVEDGNELEEGF